jgi:hypothetical protein
MYTQGIYETLEKISKLRKTQEKIDALREADSLALRIILQAAFDPSVKFLLPAGVPPYKPCELVDQQGVLIGECKKIRYFVKGFSDNLNQKKRELMFIEFLERLDKNDAVLLCSVKDKSIPFKGITLEHVEAALPGLIYKNKEINE